MVCELFEEKFTEEPADELVDKNPEEEKSSLKSRRTVQGMITRVN